MHVSEMRAGWTFGLDHLKQLPPIFIGALNDLIGPRAKPYESSRESRSVKHSRLKTLSVVSTKEDNCCARQIKRV